MRNSSEKNPALDILALDERAMSLPAARRTRILRQTMAGRGGSVGIASPAEAFLSLRLPAASWAAVLAFALLVVGAGYIWSPPGGGAVPAPPAAVAGPGQVDLSVTQVADAVILEWADGSREAFTVRKATSARDVREAPGIEVRGTRYVDRSAAEAPVVYYLVE